MELQEGYHRTFKLPADFTFDKQMAHLEDTVATKEKALDLRGYDTWSIDHRANYTNWSSPSSGSISGYGASPFDDATQITINGWNARVNQETGRISSYDAGDFNGVTKKPNGVPTIAEIANLTDNGVTVEVYVCPVDADFITNVVVTRTQLMKVKRIGSDFVTLEDIEPDSRGPRSDSDLKKITGYNAFAIDVTEKYDNHASSLADVKDSNYDAYNALKDLKAGDRVAVVPFTTDDGRTWEVGEAYVPETVTGAFTKVDTYANVNKKEGSAVAITVGGTSYPINEWNKDMLDVTGSKIKATKKDVTLYLAKDGTVLWADEIGNSDAWMIVGDYYQATNANLSGKVGWYVHGWTIGGDEVDLDLGTIRGDAERYAPGELVHYYIAEDGNGEYALEKPNYNGENHYKTGATAKDTVKKNGEGIYEVSQYTFDSADSSKAKQYQINKRNGALALENYKTDNSNPPYEYTLTKTTPTVEAAPAPAVPVKRENKTGKVDVAHDFKYSNLLYDGVKFIFVNFDGANGEVETIDFKDGVQNVDYQDLVRYNTTWRNVGTNIDSFVVSAAEAYVNNKGLVKAVVIKADSSEADLSKIAVITDTPGDKNLQTGAEGDRVNGLSYAKQYVTGPNFSIADEKTGYFDKDYAIGTILVISEKENIIVGKYFHSTYYNNGNPDAVYVEGIKTLKDTKGNDSEAGFLIGQTGSNVYTLNGKNALKPTGNSSTVVPGEDQIVDLLGDKYISGFDTYLQNGNDLKGLVRVDGNTTFVDLRAINTDRIDSMSDLLDFQPETLKLRLLVNGNDSTDTFRRAYAVIVEDGVLKTDKPTTTTGQTLNSFATVKEVNEALQKGNVIINGSWDKSTMNTYEGSDVLQIPAGRTLTVKGDFNSTGLRGITFGNTSSKLAVDGKLTVGVELIDALANVSAGSVKIHESFTFSGKMSVTGDLEVPSSVTLTITGTVNAGSVSGSGTIIVLSTNSLHIAGNVSGVTIQTGNGVAKTNGYLEVKGTMAGKLDDRNVAPSATASAPTQKIATITGEVKMSGDARLSTEKFTPSKIELAAGATITLTNGTASAPNIEVKDKTGNVIETGSEEVTFTVGAATGPVSVPTDSTKAPVVSDGVKTDAPVETVVPFVASTATVISSKTDLQNWASANGVAFERAAGGNFDETNGPKTMPWLYSKLTVDAEKIPTGTTVKATVLKDGEVITSAPLTWDASGKIKNNDAIFHWEMTQSNDSSIECLKGERGKLSGVYTIRFNWTVNGADVDGQEPVETSTSRYVEPEAIKVPADITGQRVSLNGTNVTVNDLIILSEAEGDQSLANWNGETYTFKTAAGTNDKVAFMLEVNSLGSVYSGIKFKGPNKAEVSDTFGSNGKTGAILYVGTDTYDSWKNNNYKQNMTITLVAANSNATVANIPVEFTVTMDQGAIDQLKEIFETVTPSAPTSDENVTPDTTTPDDTPEA